MFAVESKEEKGCAKGVGAAAWANSKKTWGEVSKEGTVSPSKKRVRRKEVDK